MCSFGSVLDVLLRSVPEPTLDRGFFGWIEKPKILGENPKSCNAASHGELHQKIQVHHNNISLPRRFCGDGVGVLLLSRSSEIIGFCVGSGREFDGYVTTLDKLQSADKPPVPKTLCRPIAVQHLNAISFSSTSRC